MAGQPAPCWYHAHDTTLPSGTGEVAVPRRIVDTSRTLKRTRARLPSSALAWGCGSRLRLVQAHLRRTGKVAMTRAESRHRGQWLLVMAILIALAQVIVLPLLPGSVTNDYGVLIFGLGVGVLGVIAVYARLLRRGSRARETSRVGGPLELSTTTTTTDRLDRP